LDKEERLRMGITEDFIRLSVGPETLIGDLDQALTDTLG
jgi:cystathionine beta-lyase/cystathionine gamma-synthase